eukprot:11350-Eustigmatos_ZCMA.PRE.1
MFAPVHTHLFASHARSTHGHLYAHIDHEGEEDATSFIMSSSLFAPLIDKLVKSRTKTTYDP